MSTEIEGVVSQCAVCNENKNSNPKEPLLPHTLPGRPWEKIGTDLFHYNGAEYLLCVDYYSKYPEITKLCDTTSQSVLTAMKSTFARHGIPVSVVSDNGPQYASGEFRGFSESWEFEHVTSSPGHAQSNGQAERTVQTVKNMLKKAQSGNGDPYIALLEYRNTPLEGIGLSPAQLLMGRRLKSKLPASTTLLTPENRAQVQDNLKCRQMKQKSYFDRQTQKLPDLRTGENVRIQKGDTWQPAVVVERHQLPRSFIVRTQDGRVYRRNRKHLLKTGEREFPPTEMQDIPTYTHTETAHTGSDTEGNDTEVNQDTDSHDGQAQLQLHHTRSGRQVKIPARYRDLTYLRTQAD